jgi:hypothetical protein
VQPLDQLVVLVSTPMVHWVEMAHIQLLQLVALVILEPHFRLLGHQEFMDPAAVVAVTTVLADLVEQVLETAAELEQPAAPAQQTPAVVVAVVAQEMEQAALVVQA